MGEHRAIWLEPGCVAESGEDRHWAQDDAWGKCDECERPSVKYIIATEHDALVKALESIAGWRKVNISGEYEHGLRDIIRSITDLATAALDATPVGRAHPSQKES